MIENTFQIYKGISKNKEKELWKTGIKTWNDFLSNSIIKGISEKRKKELDIQIKRNALLLKNNDYFGLFNLFPIKLHYRFYPYLKERILYLDIESYGHNKGNEITVIGIDNGEHTKIIRGDSADKSLLQKILSDYEAIVTFNGRSYDLPILKRKYRINIEGHIIIDLKHITQELGYTGGLKEIEPLFGIKRELSHKIMNGDPINLWRAYKATGDSHFIELLAEYVEADVSSLPIILEKSFNEYKKINGL